MATSVAELTDKPVTEQGASPNRRKRLLLVGAVILLVVAGIAFFVLRGGEDAGDKPPADGPVVEVAQMTANLAGSQVHYVRFGFAAVLRDGLVAADVEGRFPLLKDAALTEVQTLSAEVLRTPEGIDELRRRLTDRAAGVYPDGQVLRVVLTELVVQ